MVVIRKILGALIILLFALPTLFGIIWAVGLTKAAVSPEFVSDIPQQIIEETPVLLEEIFEDAQDRDFVSDENTRRWFRTAAEAGVSPRKLMEEIGLLGWMENELSASLTKVGDILRGDRRARTIAIDLIPLKAALRHEAIDGYLETILDRLPPCSENEMDEWMDAYDRDINWFELPACRPDIELALSVFRAERLRVLEDMDDEIELFEGVRYPSLGISRSVTLFSYGMFLIPALFLFAGAIIAATSPASFCRWFGISSIVAALPVLGLSLLIQHLTSWGLKFTPFWESGISDLEELVLEKIAWIPDLVVDHLFDEVVALAGTVCIIGLVIFALSFVVRGERRVKPKRRQEASVSPSSPAPPAPVDEESKSEKPEAAEPEAEEVVEKEKVLLPPPDSTEEEE
jgi:ABC-type glycerol-3-phosphate transport system permease component